VYILAGRTNVMGHTTEQVAVHKDRQVVSISLTISKLKGVGEDTLFIGIMQVGCQVKHLHVLLSAMQ
jgi:hypothetical protein